MIDITHKHLLPLFYTYVLIVTLAWGLVALRDLYDRGVEQEALRMEQEMTTDDFFKYGDPAVEVVQDGNDIAFHSNVEHFVTSDIRWEDTLTCHNGQRYKLETQAWEQRVAAGRIPADDEVWFYKFIPDMTEFESDLYCVMCGVVTTHTPKYKLEKHFEYCTEEFKLTSEVN